MHDKAVFNCWVYSLWQNSYKENIYGVFPSENELSNKMLSLFEMTNDLRLNLDVTNVIFKCFFSSKEWMQDRVKTQW